MPLDVVVITNPISGRKGRRSTLESLRARLTAAGRSVEIYPTQYAGDGARRAEEVARLGGRLIVAAGGDGTVNEVARGLLAAGPTDALLGILPFGTSNLVARELSIPLNPLRAIDVLLTGHPVEMDAGQAGEKLFLACIGVGWDAHVVESLSASRKGHIHFASYVRPVLRATLDYRFPRLTVETYDGEQATGELAMILNCRPYAAFFTLIPDARSDDGLLDAIVLERRGALDIPRWIWKAKRGTLHRDAGARVLRSRGFRITSTEPAPFQIDGDVGGATPLDVLVRPGVIRVLAPDSHRALKSVRT